MLKNNVSERDKIKRYLRKKMKMITQSSIPYSKKDMTFHFCWGQALFDVLMDIDIELKLGAFYKKRRTNQWRGKKD